MKVLKILLIIILTAAVRGQPVSAEPKYSLKEITPEAQAALDRRRDRFDQLTDFKIRGVAGENNRGYVEVLVADEAAEKLAEAENKDRKIIYRTIAEQHGLTGELEMIEKVFAQVQHDKARPGVKIQDESGQWVTKQ